MKKNYLKYKEMGKFFSELTETSVKCKKCKHSVNFLGKRDRMICNWCGTYIYKDEKTECKYKLHQIRRKR